MRSLVLACLAVTLTAMPVIADEPQQKPGWQFESLRGSSGESALSSGVEMSLWLYNERQNLSLNAVFQPEQAWFIVGKRYKLGSVTVQPGISVGHMMKEPWVGPYVDAEAPGPNLFGLKTKATGMLWPCVFFREPQRWRDDGVKNPETLLAGTYAEVAVWVGPVGLSYGGLDFLDDPKNQLPGIAIRQSVGKRWAAHASATHNRTAKKWMWWMGVSYSS